MSDDIKNMLNSAHKEVLSAIDLHKNGKKSSLSMSILINVKKELENMMEAMDPKIYVPSYPRFILDWPEEDKTGIVDCLIDASYRYKRMKK